MGQGRGWDGDRHGTGTGMGQGRGWDGDNHGTTAMGRGHGWDNGDETGTGMGRPSPDNGMRIGRDGCQQDKEKRQGQRGHKRRIVCAPGKSLFVFYITSINVFFFR